MSFSMRLCLEVNRLLLEGGEAICEYILHV